VTDQPTYRSSDRMARREAPDLDWIDALDKFVEAQEGAGSAKSVHGNG